MNLSLREIYECYRDEMAATLGLEEYVPERFADPEFLRQFEMKVDRLDTLIALYASILPANRN